GGIERAASVVTTDEDGSENGRPAVRGSKGETMGLTKLERMATALMRFNHLGRQLPSLEAMENAYKTGDKKTIAKAKKILAEQAKVQAEIDGILAEGKQPNG